MAISNSILSSTLRILLDEEVDNLFKSTPLLSEMKNHGGLETYDGGQKLDCPVILAEHSQITQLSNGYEPVNLAVKDALRTASYNWCDFVAPVVITRKEELSNKGERAIVSIAEARLKSVFGLLQREVDKQLVANSSTVLTELNSLADITGGVNRDGFMQAAAFGSQVGSIGGIDSATFATWQNQFVGTAAFAVTDMVDLYINCQAYSPGNGQPNLIIADQASYQAYKAAITTNERFMGDDDLDLGRLTLAFHGARLYFDPESPATIMNEGAATRLFRMYFLNTDYLKLAFDTDAQFELEDFEHISGYASRSANIMTRMQMYVNHLACQGLYTQNS
jgi:hypothetical protein